MSTSLIVRPGVCLPGPGSCLRFQESSADRSADVLVSSTDSRGVDARHDAVSGQAEAAQLLWRQDVNDERSHMGHVSGRGVGECLEAFVGQDGIGESPVGRIRLAAH
jgi:hypothetical protein